MDGPLQTSTKYCAIYCRKSSEEGLEQEFNSLDAQRKACAAFIKSQQFEGWKLIPKHYDDGGKSGGNLERPSLQTLLEDIQQGKIQVIVVYKVDRLTRSLADFAKLVELFDTHGVSFVSVTQQFNTTSSMGRLTLNVLLSFAQYEREVTAERIRDKIAASKEKGMWMGGPPPLGYDPNGRTLNVNETEAEKVKLIFLQYLKLGCVRRLQEELQAHDVRTKRWTSKTGKTHGGVHFTRGALYNILKNPLYRGHIRHKGKIYEGQHEAIIDDNLWNKVQIKLTAGTVSKKKRQSTDSLLAGKLRDENGNGFTPTYANKKGRRYRYYVNQAVLQNRKNDAGSIHRLSAPKVEGLVEDWLLNKLIDPNWITSLVLQHRPNADTHELADAVTHGASLAQGWKSAATKHRRSLLDPLIQRIIVTSDNLIIEFSPRALLRPISPCVHRLDDGSDVTQTEKIPARLKRRAQESKLIIPAKEQNKDPALIKALVRAHGWLDKIKNGEASSLREVARQEGLQPRYVEKHIKVGLLPAWLQRAILEGMQPDSLELEALKGSLWSDLA